MVVIVLVYVSAAVAVTATAHKRYVPHDRNELHTIYVSSAKPQVLLKKKIDSTTYRL